MGLTVIFLLAEGSIGPHPSAQAQSKGQGKQAQFPRDYGKKFGNRVCRKKN